MSSLNNLKKELRSLGSKEKALKSQRFFKTQKGQYGEGDIFIGVTVPEQRKVSKKYQNLPLEAIRELLYSKEHEFRLVGLYILTHQYQKGDSGEQSILKDFYLKHALRVNNWDLVDSSAPYILGHYLLHYGKKNETTRLLKNLIQSSSLWERRIAIVATLAFIRDQKPEHTFILAKLLLNDKEDLMHKATGWMLREVGKYCGRETLSSFLDVYAHRLPRTALRYSLEHYPEKQRQFYMTKKS